MRSTYRVTCAIYLVSDSLNSAQAEANDIIAGSLLPGLQHWSITSAQDVGILDNEDCHGLDDEEGMG